MERIFGDILQDAQMLGGVLNDLHIHGAIWTDMARLARIRTSLRDSGWIWRSFGRLRAIGHDLARGILGCARFGKTCHVLNSELRRNALALFYRIRLDVEIYGMSSKDSTMTTVG